MNNNDILRRIRYTFDIDDSTMAAIFAHTGMEVSRAQLSDWLKKEDDPAFQVCTDPDFSAFLNGFIIEKRGKKEGAERALEQRLNNNLIFVKLKIALNLKAGDILGVLKLAEIELSNHELSAFFRRAGHKHYRECKDQVLRKFLKGLQLKYRETPP